MKNKTKKPKMALCMIVKNESHIIKETLKSITPYIDYYVINDTGSTDNTIQVIKDYFNSVNIEGEVITHEFRTCPESCHGKEWKRYSFFHFGWNRSYSLELW
jgi:glycosyltransferase involved in cell wall biosynthesis